MKTIKRLVPLFAPLWYWIIKTLGWQSPEEVEPTPTKPIKQRRSESKEESALWHFRSSILDRLDEYFVCIRRLRRHDPDSYDLFSRTGFSISADRFFMGDHEQNRAALGNATNRWSFGGFFFPRTEEIQNAGIVPSFIYFKKLNRPSIAERFNGDVYSLTLIYDDRRISEHWRSKFSYPVTCHIGVDALGNTRLLRERIQLVSRIQPRRKHGRRTDGFNLRMYSWRYPSWLFYGAIDHNKSPETFATDILVMALVTHVKSMEKIIVRVNRDGLVAAFGIELARAKYFFADRDTSALAADGKRKRIFHSVVAHPRKTLRHVPEVRAHYRGLRHFDWNGYGIKIVLPENNRLVAYPTPSRYEEDLKAAQIPEWCTSKRAGKIMAEALDA